MIQRPKTIDEVYPKQKPWQHNPGFASNWWCDRCVSWTGPGPRWEKYALDKYWPDEPEHEVLIGLLCEHHYQEMNSKRREK